MTKQAPLLAGLFLSAASLSFIFGPGIFIAAFASEMQGIVAGIGLGSFFLGIAFWLYRRRYRSQGRDGTGVMSGGRAWTKPIIKSMAEDGVIAGESRVNCRLELVHALVVALLRWILAVKYRVLMWKE